jgi:hypothetical protein
MSEVKVEITEAMNRTGIANVTFVLEFEDGKSADRAYEMMPSFVKKSVTHVQRSANKLGVVSAYGAIWMSVSKGYKSKDQENFQRVSDWVSEFAQIVIK